MPGNHMPDVSHFPGSAEWGQADYQDPVRFFFNGDTKVHVVVV